MIFFIYLHIIEDHGNVLIGFDTVHFVCKSSRKVLDPALKFWSWKQKNWILNFQSDFFFRFFRLFFSFFCFAFFFTQRNHSDKFQLSFRSANLHNLQENKNPFCTQTKNFQKFHRIFMKKNISNTFVSYSNSQFGSIPSGIELAFVKSK